MNWIDLTFIVLGSYFLYYTINILLDVAKSKKVKTAGDNTLIQFEEEEPTVVKDDFTETQKSNPLNEFEEEEPVTITAIEEAEEEEEEEKTQSFVETKKKESNEEENIHEEKSEEKDTQDVKFQSMPVSEFLANAKKFSSQIDFS